MEEMESCAPLSERFSCSCMVHGFILVVHYCSLKMWFKQQPFLSPSLGVGNGIMSPRGKLMCHDEQLRPSKFKFGKLRTVTRFFSYSKTGKCFSYTGFLLNVLQLQTDFRRRKSDQIWVLGAVGMRPPILGCCGLITCNTDMKASTGPYNSCLRCWLWVKIRSLQGCTTWARHLVMGVI